MKRRIWTSMHNIWFSILMGAWGVGMLLMAAEIRGSVHRGLSAAIRRCEGHPAAQTLCALYYLAAAALPVLLWPVFVVAELLTKPGEPER